MTKPERDRASGGPWVLGVEAGGTRTVAILAARAGAFFRRSEAGPANLRLLDDRALVRHFRQLAVIAPHPAAIAIGLAGARTAADRARIRRAAGQVWPAVPCHPTNDLETALMAAEPSELKAIGHARVLVLSGTGSCCFGRAPNGRTAKIGGWGHLLGDKGSGYEIGLRSLKAVVYYYDRDGRWPKLGEALLRALSLNEPDDLISWIQKASKAEVAALAKPVFDAWSRRDPIARDILAAAAASLARDAVDCARRLVSKARPVQFILAGGVLLQQPRFAALVRREIERHWKNAAIAPLQREGAWGAVQLALDLLPARKVAKPRARQTAGAALPPVGLSVEPTELSAPDRRNLAASPTEQRHPRSRRLDQLSLSAAIRLMLDEDRTLPAALWAERRRIERGIGLIVRSFRRGGRLFYFGAGTSGRLGVLDASECPPTFHTDPALVQGVIAGGQRALWEAVEGAEDDPAAGERAVLFRGITRRDTVVGIAASGRTPFVWGALRAAGQRGAQTILLSFNPNLIIPRRDRPTLVIAPRIGPELLTGSTRLKAGTATKLVLNMFTTLAMVRMGKVMSNLMIDVKASNAKLRDRAVRMVTELTGAEPEAARVALVRSDWRIKPACARLQRGSSRGKGALEP